MTDDLTSSSRSDHAMSIDFDALIEGEDRPKYRDDLHINSAPQQMRGDAPQPPIVPRAAVWLPRPSDPCSRARIKMPYEPGARRWIRSTCGKGTVPEFERDTRVWTVARHHFDAVANALAKRYGAVLLMQDYTLTEYCTAACQRAMSSQIHCECSCMGAGHGGHGGSPSWTNSQVFVYHDRQRRCWIQYARGETPQNRPQHPASSRAVSAEKARNTGADVMMARYAEQLRAARSFGGAQ